MLPMPTLDALVLTGVFRESAVLSISPVRVSCGRPIAAGGFPSNAHRVIGVLETLAALFLSNPVTRIWGVSSGGLCEFLFATVALLNRGKYAYSVPGLLLTLAPCRRAWRGRFREFRARARNSLIY